jgi:hemerythrin superfamily protein
MPSSSPSSSRAQNSARDDILAQLKDDHKKVKKAYKQFEKLDVEDDAQECESIVQQVLDDLTLHAALEEEFLYPAVKELIAEPDLIEEAEVEHESMHNMIDQLRDMSAGDEKYAARFTVLCEYVLHHVKEEEGEMFPQLARVKLDWEAIADEMAQRRMEATGEGEDDEAASDVGETVTADADDETTMGSDDAEPAGDGQRGGARDAARGRSPGARR